MCETIEPSAAAAAIKKEPMNIKQEHNDDKDNFYFQYFTAQKLYKQGKVDEFIKTISRAITMDAPEEDIASAVQLFNTFRSVMKLKDEFLKDEEKKSLDEVDLKVKVKRRRVSDGDSSKSKTLTCDECHKTFAKVFSLNRHMYLHTGEKPHKCKICGKAFIQKTDMERHETTHQNVFNFSCNECDKKFKTKKNLYSHRITHSENRPHQCEICNKSFKIKRMLKYHEISHTDVKPYQCKICNKGFPAKGYLKSHMDIHTQERPFECEMCDSTFKRKYDLKFHLRSQHFMDKENEDCKVFENLSQVKLENSKSDLRGR